MKVLLTSAGFENKKLEKLFLELIGKESKDIKVVFIPTAAVTADAVLVLQKCMQDLLSAGIFKDNILVYDMHKVLPLEKLLSYDAIYVCGGNTKYLLDRVLENNFDIVLKEYIRNGGVYVGVSAGSLITTQSINNNLGLINCILSVHCEEGSKAGQVDTGNCPHIYLTNKQAIYLTENSVQIME